MEQSDFKHGDLAFVRVLSRTDQTPQLACYRPIWADDGWEFLGTNWTAPACEVEVIKRVRLVEQVTSGGFGWVDANGNLEK